MVNSIPDPRDADLVEYRDRALRATDVSFVITDAIDPAAPIVWVNEAFTRTTGYSLEEVVGRNPNLLHGPGTDRDETRRLTQAILDGRSTTATVLNYKRDGTPFWNQVSVSPVPGPDGTVTHWVGIQVDVTEQVRHADAQARSIETERRARVGLALVSHVSDLLADVENPYVLREIAAVLRADVVAWAEFFLADGGLHPASGIDGGAAEVPRRARPGGAQDTPEGTDPVQDLLDGSVHGPVELSLATEAPGPTTRWLVDHLRTATQVVAGPVGTVLVHVIPGRRRHLGVLATVARSTEGLSGPDDDDATVLSLVVRRVGLAVENVRLYVREHRLAETLQRAMLPEQVDIRGLDVWTYYAPSSTHAQVGGDWYDVLQVSPEVAAVVIGDVVGHDVEAAASMGQLRSVVRSYAYESTTPGAVLDRVDHLISGLRIPRSASLVFATLTQMPLTQAPPTQAPLTQAPPTQAPLPVPAQPLVSSRWVLQYSRAGHLPPLVARGGDVLQLLDGGGPMIGYGSGDRTSGTVDLEPGDVVVLYTDGLIERRDRALRDGLEALVDVARGVGRLDAAGVGEQLLSRLAEEPEDDIAVVVVRVPDPGSALDPTATAPRRRRWSLPSEAASIGRARQAVARTSEAWGLGGVPAAELVVSELVANAVLHGWGHVVLRLFDTGEGLRIEVEDSNPAPPVTTDGHLGRVGGYGMRIVERLAEWGWRPSGQGKLVWARVRPVGAGSGLSGGDDPEPPSAD